MVDRGPFTFDALITETPSEDAGALTPEYTVRREGGSLLVELVLHNDGLVPVDVMVRLGARLGPRLTARIAGEAVDLVQELDPASLRDRMSRVAPAPQFRAVGPGKREEIGTYRFACPDPDPRVDLVLKIVTDRGQAVLSTVRVLTVQ